MNAFSIVDVRRVEPTERPEPEVGPTDVLIDIRYVGLCGSDLALYRGQSPMAPFPRVPGHEVCGVVRAVGPAVPEGDLRKGDRVMVSPYTSCGRCPACRVGRPNCCQFNETLGVQREGALGAQVALPYEKVFKSEVLGFEELALVEPLSVGYHAANRGEVCERDTVAILGCGAIGLGAIAASARKGARAVVVDIDDAKLEMGRKFGAAEAIHGLNEDVAARMAEITGGEGPRVVIEAIGLPQTFRQAVDLVCFAGRVVYIGYAKSEVAYDTKEFVRKELDVRGSRNALHVFPVVIQMLEARERPFLDMITRTYPFDRTPRAFADWDADPGRYTKILIDLQN